MVNLQQHNASEVLSLAHATNEQFEDVTVITARGALIELAYQAAADLICKHELSLTTELVQMVATTIVEQNKIKIQEYVQVSDQGITVCIDVDDINGDTVMWSALDRVAKALDSLNGSVGTVTYGGDLTFDPDHIKQLMTLR